MEECKDIEGYNNVYQVSDAGRIRSKMITRSGDKMFTLEWNDFKNGNFAVQCKTEDAANDFFKIVRTTDIDFYGIDFPTWGMFEESTCYFINTYDKLDLCHKDYCDYNNIHVVEWKD